MGKFRHSNCNREALNLKIPKMKQLIFMAAMAVGLGSFAQTSPKANPGKNKLVKNAEAIVNEKSNTNQSEPILKESELSSSPKLQPTEKRKAKLEALPTSEATESKRR